MKKARGIRRKTDKMIDQIEAYTLKFPTAEFEGGYWHLHIPVAQDFISSDKTPVKNKRLCIQTLLDCMDRLIALKPDDNENYRVVVAITLPDLFGSQIIIFKGDSYFNGFFNRNGAYQKWLNLPDNRNIKTEWDLSTSDDLEIMGFKEVIIDDEDDGDHFESEIWFIGELT